MIFALIYSYRKSEQSKILERYQTISTVLDILDLLSRKKLTDIK